MKALAASSIGQYEESVRALADYNRTVELGLSICFRHGAPAALTNAIEDALVPFGAKIREQYLPPHRILELAGLIPIR